MAGAEYRVKRSIRMQTERRWCTLTPIDSNSAFIVSVYNKESDETLSGRVHVNELMHLLETNLKSK